MAIAILFSVVWVRRFELPASGRTTVPYGTDCRPLNAFSNIHRMFEIANFATGIQPLLGFKRPEFPPQNDKKRKEKILPFSVVWVRRFELPAS